MQKDSNLYTFSPIRLMYPGAQNHLSDVLYTFLELAQYSLRQSPNTLHTVLLIFTYTPVLQCSKLIFYTFLRSPHIPSHIEAFTYWVISSMVIHVPIPNSRHMCTCSQREYLNIFCYIIFTRFIIIIYSRLVTFYSIQVELRNNIFH